MSPRLAGVRERRDKTWYDTHTLEAGETKRFFEEANVGNIFHTNLQIKGSLLSDQAYVIMAIGVRLLGKTRLEEDPLLDYLRFDLRVGHTSQHDILGPQASMTRHLFTSEELRKLQAERESDSPGLARVGYHLARPVVIPVRQNFSVVVEAAEELPQAVTARVHLFGLQTRDIP